MEEQDERDGDGAQTLDVRPKSSILGRGARFLTRMVRALRDEGRFSVNWHYGRTMACSSAVRSRSWPWREHGAQVTCIRALTEAGEHNLDAEEICPSVPPPPPDSRYVNDIEITERIVGGAGRAIDLQGPSNGPHQGRVRARPLVETRSFSLPSDSRSGPIRSVRVADSVKRCLASCAQEPPAARRNVVVRWIGSLSNVGSRCFPNVSTASSHDSIDMELDNMPKASWSAPVAA